MQPKFYTFLKKGWNQTIYQKEKEAFFLNKQINCQFLMRETAFVGFLF